MISWGLTYVAGDSVVHRWDSRVKLTLTLAYSVALFFADTVEAMALLTLTLTFVIAAGRLPVKSMAKLLAPVGVLAAFTLVANGLGGMGLETATVSEKALDAAGGSGRSGAIDGWYTIVKPWVGGLLVALRVLLLGMASVTLTWTTTSLQLMAALRWLLAPLRVIRVPVDDVAMTLALALRFIPLTAEELNRVKAALLSRGAPLSTGNPWKRFMAWSRVLAPLFVGMFRRAETLAQAMDARCYGNQEVRRTSLQQASWTLRDGVVLTVGLVLCLLAALGL